MRQHTILSLGIDSNAAASGADEDGPMARKGLTGFTPALVLAIAAGSGCAPDDAITSKTYSVANPPMYLALGDSIAMGFDPFVDAHNANAYVGYPEYLQSLIDIPHTNAGCYGETTGSFLSPTAPDRGCRHFKEVGLVRAGYTGTQLEFMIDFIQSHSRLELITLALGANDIVLMTQQCGYDPQCVQEQLPGVLQVMGENLATIFATIRGLGYDGQIVVPLYYDAFPTVFPPYSQLIALNNAVLSQVADYFSAQVADVASAFTTASEEFGGDPCTAGLLIPLTGSGEYVVAPPGASCESHPSPAGAELIAETIAAVVPPRPE